MNKKTKIALLLCILGMLVGFAAVSTVLYLTGNTNIASNTSDFDVYFSKAVENNVENNALIQDKTHIAFETELTSLNERYVLDYDVTNASKNYDAEVRMNCVGGNEYLRVENKFNTVSPLRARETRKGTLTLIVIKAPLEEVRVNITCEISGSATEREELNVEEVAIEDVDFLAVGYSYNYSYRENRNDKIYGRHKYGSIKKYVQVKSEYCEDTSSESCTNFLSEHRNEATQWIKENGYLNGPFYRLIEKSGFESITFKDTKDVPEGALGPWDVSFQQRGNILAYALDEDENGKYELYIGQDGGVVACPDSSILIDKNYFLGIRQINLENLDTSIVEDMSQMFYYYSGTELDVSHFDTRNVFDMSEMFMGCTRLESLDLASFDTRKVVNMNHMFWQCSNLTTLDVSSFDTSNVTNMSYMFSGRIEDSNISNSVVMNLQEIKGLENFDTSNVTDMSYMFYLCPKLENIDVSHFNTENVTNMKAMFSQCGLVTELDLSSFNTSNVTDMSNMFEMSNVWTFNRIICQLKSIKGLENFNTSQVIDMSSMFYYCISLNALDVSHFDTSNVTNMSYMFASCVSIINLDCRLFNTSKVTNMSYMFSGCRLLTALDLSSFDTSKVTDMSYMFSDCSNLTGTITIRGTNCTKYEKMFYSSLPSYATPENLGMIVNYTADAEELVDKMIADKYYLYTIGIKGSVVA